MVDGGLDAVFLIVYVGQPSLQTTPDAFERNGYERAYQAAIEKFDAVHRLAQTIARFGGPRRRSAASPPAAGKSR